MSLPKNNSVALVEVMREAIKEALFAVPFHYIQDEPREAQELIAAKVLTNLLVRGYYVMTERDLKRIFEAAIDNVTKGRN